jgi:cyclic pyranopterin phosphate synthase
MESPHQVRELRDGFGRVHDDLRISVTDRCNLRCNYCMPEEPEWFPHAEILRFEETLRIVGVMTGLGVRRLRLTGGEPLVRRNLPQLVRMLAGVPGIEDLSLTTNAVLLEGIAATLAEAGLRRINVSLDTLRRERYAELTRRDVLDRVLRGIDAAIAADLTPVKVNTVLLRGVNDDEVEELVGHARSHGWELRFIEFMPLENGGSWNPSRVVSGEEVRRRVDRLWPIEPDPHGDPHAPATSYDFVDGSGSIAFIDSVTRPFCASCSRLRLTSDGKIYTCLYGRSTVDLKKAMREGVTDATLERMLLRAVEGKGRGGALEILERRAALPLERTMHQIGG